MSSALRLVYDEHAVPPRAAGVRLTGLDELEPLVRRLLHERYDGELLLRGHDTARICLFEGAIPWVRCNGYPEHLGHVLQRELGLPDAVLRGAMAHCRSVGQRLGEGLLGLGLAQPHELRDCLYRHISDQLWELLTWPGPVVVEQSQWPHRYDHAFTFDLDALLRRPTAPTADEQACLEQLVQRCRERMPGLQLACVVDSEEGVPLHARPEDDEAAQDLLGLCIVGLRRLAGNRVTRDEGPPLSMVLTAADACVVVQHVGWHPGWLLVLGGTHAPGRLLSVAQAAVRATATA
jgi:hypothetical protein